MKVLLAQLLTIQASLGFMFGNGITVTDVSDRCGGDDLIVNCSAKDEDSSVLRFRFNNTDVANESITIVDSEVSQFRARNLTVTDAYVWVVCCIRNCSDVLASKSTRFHVYQRPQEVQDFRCEVYNWENNMTCSWNLGVKYHRDVLNEKHFQFRWKEDMAANWSNCPNLYPEEKCVLPLINLGFSMEIQFNISSPGCSDVVTKELTINTLDYVKPAPVTSVTVNSVNSTCVTLSWSHDKLARAKKYRLSYVSENRLDQFETVVEVGYFSTCQLHPFTDYRFSVEVHPNRTKGYWSEKMTVNAKTLAAVPAAAPVLTTSSYQWYNQDCEDESTAVIYWQSLKEIDRNGPSPRIHIRTDPVFNSQTQLYTVPDDVAQVTMFLRCDTAYKVTLQAINEVGAAPQMSTLTVPAAQSDIPTTEFVKIEMDNSSSESHTLYIEWEKVTTVSDAARLHYILYWCRSSGRGCQEQIQWRRFDSDTLSTTLNTFRPFENMYGIAVEVDSVGSKGLSTKHSCVYTRGTRPGVPESLEAQPGEEDNSLYVKWQRLLCQRGTPFITGYRIYYSCQSDGCPGKKHEEVGARESSVLLRDLLPDKEYEIQIQALSDGEAGPLSDSVTGTPGNNDLKDAAVAGIVVASLLGLAGVIAVVYCCKRCSRKIKDRFKPNTNYYLPEILEGNKNKAFEESSSDLSLRKQSISSVVGDLPQITIPPEPPVRQMSVDSGVPEDLSSPGITGEHSWSKVRLLEEVSGVRQLPDDYTYVTHETGQDLFPSPQSVTIATGMVYHDVPSVLPVDLSDSSGGISSYIAVGDAETTPTHTRIIDPLNQRPLGKERETMTGKLQISVITQAETTPSELQSHGSSSSFPIGTKVMSDALDNKRPLIIKSMVEHSAVSPYVENCCPNAKSNPDENYTEGGYSSPSMARKAVFSPELEKTVISPEVGYAKCSVVRSNAPIEDGYAPTSMAAKSVTVTGNENNQNIQLPVVNPRVPAEGGYASLSIAEKPVSPLAAENVDEPEIVDQTPAGDAYSPVSMAEQHDIPPGIDSAPCSVPSPNNNSVEVSVATAHPSRPAEDGYVAASKAEGPVMFSSPAPGVNENGYACPGMAERPAVPTCSVSMGNPTAVMANGYLAHTKV